MIQKPITKTAADIIGFIEHELKRTIEAREFAWNDYAVSRMLEKKANLYLEIINYAREPIE